MGLFSDKRILVTGGCGSIGSQLVRQLLEDKPRQIIIYDNNESRQFHMQQEFKKFDVLRPVVADVKDKGSLLHAMQGADLVFHAAALKHVPLCEYNPFESVAVNVYGTQNVIECAKESGVEKVVSISTDKAVHPINTMGATKLLSEKLILNAGAGPSGTVFSSVRFGNVLNSDGSVIPIFRRQIKAGGPVTITSEKMTRFFMSMNEAARLVLKAARHSRGGEIFILKMGSLRITDLAKVLIQELAPVYGHDPGKIREKTIGIRPGEKLHETLFTPEEAPYIAFEDDMYVLRLPVPTPQYIYRQKRVQASKKPGFSEYSSENGEYMSLDEIREKLVKEKILEENCENA